MASPISHTSFIWRCIQKANNNKDDFQNQESDSSQDISQDSLLDYFDYEQEDSIHSSLSSEGYYDSVSVPSLSSYTSNDSDFEDEDDSTIPDASVKSATSKKSTSSSVTDNMSLNRDMLPKSFLQLKGITVGNLNMGCNFRVEAAIAIIWSTTS